MCERAYEVFFQRKEEFWKEDIRDLMSREIFFDPETVRRGFQDSYFLNQISRGFGSLERDPRMKIYSQET
jgi:hypothetical protein